MLRNDHPTMSWIDTHAHLYHSAFDQDREAAVARCAAAGLEAVYLPNLDVTTLEPLWALHERHPKLCRPMVGLHPCYVREDFEVQLAQLASWLERPGCCAIGEIGLDAHEGKAYWQQQLAALHCQLGWALEHKLPVVLHCRESLDTVLQVLQQPAYQGLRGILHCFTGTLAQARAAIHLGFYLGIGGIVTFSKAPLAAVVAQLPLDHLVLETDSPYLAPAPLRGKRNEPALLVHTAAQVARAHQVSLEELARRTTANALRALAPLP